MSRKKLLPGQRAPKSETFNSLMKQLEDPRSLMSFLPPDLQRDLAFIPEYLLDIPEEELLDKLEREFYFFPSPQHEALRNNFWAEYDRVQFSKVENMMVMTNVYLGIFTREGFNKLIVETPHVAAFILCKPMQYEAVMQALQNNVNRKFNELLNIPVKKKNGEYQDVKLLEIILKTAMVIDMRNKGSFIQRSETKNLNVSKSKTEHTYTGLFSAASGEGKTAQQLDLEIADQLKELEEEARKQLPPPTPQFDKTVVIETVEYTEVKDERNK